VGGCEEEEIAEEDETVEVGIVQESQASTQHIAVSGATHFY
jgi:hypothetical protein